MRSSYFGMNKQVTGNYLRFDNKKLSENLIQKTANFASSKMFCLEASSSNTDFLSHLSYSPVQIPLQKRFNIGGYLLLKPTDTYSNC